MILAIPSLLNDPEAFHTEVYLDLSVHLHIFTTSNESFGSFNEEAFSIPMGKTKVQKKSSTRLDGINVIRKSLLLDIAVHRG